MRQRSVVKRFFARVPWVIPVACLGLVAVGYCLLDFTPPPCPPSQLPTTKTTSHAPTLQTKESIVRGGVELLPGQLIDSRRRDRSIEKLRTSGYFDPPSVSFDENAESVAPPASSPSQELP